MDFLPDCCLLLIFKLLHPMDLGNISLVSRRFYCLLLTCKSIFRLIDFSEAEERITALPTRGVWQNLQHVKYLSLRCCVEVKNFSVIKELTSLLVLDVYSTQIGDDLLCSLLPLKGVDIGYCENITTRGLGRFLKKQPHLIYVGLAGLKNVISEEVLHALSSCNMKYMDISESSITGSLGNLFRDKRNMLELSLQGTSLAEISSILNNHSWSTLRILEIGPIPEFLWSQEEECIDDILEALPSLQGLRILSLINCTIRNTSNDPFKHFISPLKMYLWQCHQKLIACVKRSSNENITYEINPFTQLSKILYITYDN